MFPALKSAESAVSLCPNWWVGLQTLGRAQLGLGEVEQAVKTFSRAVHIRPDQQELWREDLLVSFRIVSSFVQDALLLDNTTELVLMIVHFSFYFQIMMNMKHLLSSLFSSITVFQRMYNPSICLQQIIWLIFAVGCWASEAVPGDEGETRTPGG